MHIYTKEMMEEGVASRGLPPAERSSIGLVFYPQRVAYFAQFTCTKSQCDL